MGEMRWRWCRWPRQGRDKGCRADAGAGGSLEAIRQAVYENGVALFRDQHDFTPEAHIAFARRWGGIDLNNYFPLTKGHPEIAVVRKRADQVTNIGGGWHTDHS